MFRTAVLLACTLALSTSAMGKGRHQPFTAIKVIDKASPLAASLDEADPRAGWLAAEAQPEPLAARTKADILIESLGSATATIWYNSDILLDEPWGQSTDGTVLIYGIDTAAVEGDDPDDPGTIVIIGRDGPYAEIVEPTDLTWGQVATEHLAYLVVDSTGAATIALPTTVLGLLTVEEEPLR